MENKIEKLFIIKDSFFLDGRGRIYTGTQLTGRFAIGDEVKCIRDDSVYKITGVMSGAYHNLNVGLQLTGDLNNLVVGDYIYK